MGPQVKNTDNRRNVFLPQTSDNAPRTGAMKNDKKPYKISIFRYHTFTTLSNKQFINKFSIF